MIITTTEQIEGKKFQILGIVKGSTVQSKNIGRDFLAGLKNIVGGEISDYTEMMDEARRIATQRMVTEAGQLGADAIVGMRFATSAIMQSAAEVIAYGTAVKYIV
ncbi:MAG: YbjQ family protein [Lachnospiraceae bacterium]|nr:YbjQ family protein [Lachnospiraceae bacterium]